MSYIKSIPSGVIIVYGIAFLIRVVLAGIFLDRDDGVVFLVTSEDIIDHGTNIYYEGSAQERFNYFPLAYLAILPGMLIYYLVGFENLILQRIMLKLPLIICDLFAAWLLSKRSPEHLGTDAINNYKVDNWKRQIPTRLEFLVLFNPIIIYTSSVKGQFDIIPTIFMIIAWRYYLEGRIELSGIMAGIAILFKQYGVLLSFYVGLSLLKRDWKSAIKFTLGHIVSTAPILLIAVLLNYEGLVEHAILYHLDRPPSGMSVTSIIYYPLKSVIDFLGASYVAIIYTQMMLVVFKVLLIYFLLYLGNHLWNTENTDVDVMRTILYGFIVFFALNFVLWEQYFVALIILWVEFKNEKRELIHEQAIYWNFVFSPIAISYRVTTSTPVDMMEFFGEYYFEIFWFTGFGLHFLILFLFVLTKKPMFKNKHVTLLYIGFALIVVPLHYFAIKYFFEIVNGYLITYPEG